MKALKILASPVTLLISIALGVLIAYCGAPLLPFIRPISVIYLKLLQMCVIPLVVAAVTVNIGALLARNSGGLLLKWLAACAATLILATAGSAAIARVMDGFLRPDAGVQRVLAGMAGSGGTDVANYVTRITYYGDPPAPETKAFGFMNFVYSLFPDNIFQALASSDMLKILTFFIIAGVVMALMPKDKTASLYNGLNGVYDVFRKLIDCLLVPFPIAMMAMIAVQFSAKGVFGLIGSLFRLVMVMLITMALLCACIFIVVQLTSRRPLREHLRAIKRSFFIAIGTGSCLATVGAAMEDCEKHLKLRPAIVRSVMPIGITICQPGVAASVATASVFATYIYGVEITPSVFALITLCSVIFSLAVIGVPGVIAVSMLSIVLDPLFIPSALIITVFLAIIPIINPLAVFASVYGNFAVASCLGGGAKNEGQ